MPDTFESLLVDLSRAGVDYLVAGGVAVCLNGFVRATQDLDLLVEASPANLRRLLACLATFGEGFARELSPEDFPMEEGAVRVNEDFTLDLFTLMRNRTFADFAATARRLEDRRDRGAIPRPRIADRAEVRFGTGKGSTRCRRAARNHRRRSAARLCESRGADATSQLETG